MRLKKIISWALLTINQVIRGIANENEKKNEISDSFKVLFCYFMLLTNKPVHTKDNIIVIPSLECDEQVVLV